MCVGEEDKNINIEELVIPQTRAFKYLLSTISDNGMLMRYIENRIIMGKQHQEHYMGWKSRVQI